MYRMAACWVSLGTLGTVTVSLWRERCFTSKRWASVTSWPSLKVLPFPPVADDAGSTGWGGMPRNQSAGLRSSGDVAHGWGPLHRMEPTRCASALGLTVPSPSPWQFSSEAASSTSPSGNWTAGTTMPWVGRAGIMRWVLEESWANSGRWVTEQHPGPDREHVCVCVQGKHQLLPWLEQK